MVTPEQRMEGLILALCDELTCGLRSFYATKVLHKSELRLTPTLFNTFYWSRLDNCALIKDSIFETITPVNTFRIVFNRYLGGEFELLPNRSYFSPVPDQYKFEQVTSRCQT